MVKMNIRKIILIYSLILVLGNSICYSQDNSKFLVSLSFNIPRIMVFSFDYYPNENFFLQVSFGGSTHFLNVGTSINYINDASKPNLLTHFGVKHLTGGGHHPEYSEMNTDSLYQVGGSFSTIDFGIGRQFISNNRVWFFSLGPSYVFNQTKEFVNKNEEYITKDVSDLKYMGYLDIGAYMVKEKQK